MKNALLRLEPVLDTRYRLRSVRPVRPIPTPGSDTAALLREMLATNPAHFAARTALADQSADAGAIEAACQLRWEGAQLVCDLLDRASASDETVLLDWDDPYTASALTMVYDSAADHFVIGDFELATALLESVLDADPEDHSNASELLAFCYAALEEWELFDEILSVLPPESLSTRLASYWGTFRRAENQPENQPGERSETTAKSAALRTLIRTESPALFREWSATDHDPDPNAANPPAAVEARRLWLRTESLWREFPEFVAFLKG
ncbi:MAG: hypothetical protein K2G93_08890 [Rikenella sp.]|nr:hypothetical protein [Rikenella sp.]